MKQNDDIASDAFEFEMTRANDKELYQHTPCSCCFIVITSVAVVQAFMQTNMIVSHSKRKKHSLGAFKVSKNPMCLALCLSVVCAIIASAALMEDPVQGSIELINDVESLHLNNKGGHQLVDESSIGMEDGDTNDEESLGGEMEIDTPKSVKMRKGNAIKTF